MPLRWARFAESRAEDAACDTEALGSATGGETELVGRRAFVKLDGPRSLRIEPTAAVRGRLSETPEGSTPDGSTTAPYPIDRGLNDGEPNSLPCTAADVGEATGGVVAAAGGGAASFVDELAGSSGALEAGEGLSVLEDVSGGSEDDVGLTTGVGMTAVVAACEGGPELDAGGDEEVKTGAGLDVPDPSVGVLSPLGETLASCTEDGVASECEAGAGADVDSGVLVAGAEGARALDDIADTA